MKMINWEIFFGNSSTEAAIAEFCLGVLDFTQFSRACWNKECKKTIKELKRRGYKKARRAAREAMNRRGFRVSDFDYEKY